jgi:hypothetical protein
MFSKIVQRFQLLRGKIATGVGAWDFQYDREMKRESLQ